MYGFVFLITVILIVIAILLLPISIKVQLGNKTTYTLDLTFFSIVFSKTNKNEKTTSKSTNKKSTSLKRRVELTKTIFKLTKLIIKRSRVNIDQLEITNLHSLLHGEFTAPIIVALLSTILAIISNYSKSFLFNSSKYILSDANVCKPLIDFSLSFFLYDLIIFVCFALYLHLKMIVRSRSNDRICNR